MASDSTVEEVLPLPGGPVQARVPRFWAERTAFYSVRAQLERSYLIIHSCWWRQPRVTSKSSLIIMQAAAAADRRAILQVASCRLGMVIQSQTEPASHNEPHHEP